MERSSRFLRLPTAERRLLVKSALLLETIRLGMRLLPFRTLRRLTSLAADAPLKPPRRADEPERVARSVEVASWHTPGVKTCLAQALAAQVLLARRGYPALLHIGVVKGEQERFRAHAWVEAEGKVIIGGSELDRYTPLAVFGAEGSLNKSLDAGASQGRS